jgi:gluconolactonase
MRLLAEKVGFTEGPVWTGERLLVTSISRGRLYEIPWDGGMPTTVCETGGGPNGAAIAADGSVWITQNGGHVITQLAEPVVAPGIQRWDGDVVTYAVTGEFRAPNDLTFHPSGSLWFTDPFERMSREEERPGRVWRHDPTAGTTSVAAESGWHPNGLAFSPDGATLYVTESTARRVMSYRVEGGLLSEPTPLATLAGEPDGLAIDAEGGLWIATHEQDNAVVRLDSSGKLIERIPTEGMFPTNVCFAGAGETTLVITSPIGGRVYALDVGVQGAALTGRQH